MKLYSLTLRAIGPFAGEHQIDLAAVGRSGLFLLEGPTGAGKSTVIDAVVFALYGHVAGAGASKQRLYSHHAAAGVEPYVELIFETQSGIFGVKRTPAYERPKKRGAGTRMINESVVLTRLTDVDRPSVGQTISTRASEVGDEITRLIGLRRDQFLQTVVLAQGEFATFLRSSGEDRKKLLETIFRTDVYEQITRELVAARKQAGHRTAEAERAVEQAQYVLKSVANVDHVDQVATVVEQVTAQAAERRAAADQARQELAASEADLRHAEALADALRRRSELRQRHAELEHKAAAIDQARFRLEAGARAELVRPALRACEAADAELSRARDRRDHARTRQAADLDSERAAALVDDLSGEAERLAQLQQLHDELPDRARRRNELTARLATVRRDIDELAARREARPSERKEITKKLAEAREAQAARPGLEHVLRDAQSRYEAAIKVEALAREVAQARGLVKQLAADAATATHVAKELQLARIRGIAGELAEALVVGQACAVCGSAAHPHPAARGVDHPGEDEVTGAERRQQQLTAALTEAEAAADVARHELAHWTERSDGRSIPEAEAEQNAAQATLDATDRAAWSCSDLDERLAELDEQAAADAKMQAEFDSSAATLAERVEQADQAIAMDSDRIERAIAGRGDSLPDVIAAVKVERAAVREFIEADRAYGTALAAADARADELQDAMRDHDFANRHEAGRASLAPDERARLQDAVDSYQADRAIVEDALSRPDIAVLTGDEVPGLAAARERREACAEVSETAIGRAAAAQNQHRQVLAAAEELTGARQRLAEVGSEARAVTAMAGVADGTSERNMKSLTLGTYVLLRRFEEVVVAANRRLNIMSYGRFQLRVSNERERSESGRRLGLSLAVIDAKTSREREPRTLSGGETFYVSLCLALGLADAVSDESGGVRLGTLFVDEGFGSLDPQTLDTVMAELSRLADGGRSVGLVSHVEELKQRVSERISVRRCADGSSTLTVTA